MIFCFIPKKEHLMQNAVLTFFVESKIQGVPILFFFWGVGGLGQYPLVLRTYFWLCDQGLLLMD